MIRLRKEGGTMKKMMTIYFVFLMLFVVSGCKSEMSFISHPVGYGLVDSDHVAKGSFDYISTLPNNPNTFFLTTYALPHVWAEVDVDDAFDEENPNIVKLVDGVLVRYFAKYILIGNELFTLVVDSTTNPKGVCYQNLDKIDIIDLLDTEERSKWYIEQTDLNSVYIVDVEQIPYDTYKSVLYDALKSNYIQVKATGLNITYVGENETMPEFWQNFKGYDRDLINQLFNRVLEKAFDPEYKKLEFK